MSKSTKDKTRYRWVYVESIKTSKTTGNVTESLKIYLCIGNKVLREADMASAYQFERQKKEEGYEFTDSISIFLDDQKSKIEDPKNYKPKIVRMNPKQFREWRAKEEKPKQKSIFDE